MMDPRPYIICHMVTSIDGKVTGNFLSMPESVPACETYYELNRKYKAMGASGFIFGRVTMEESFTGGWYPDLSDYAPMKKCCGYHMNFWLDDELLTGNYAIAFDPHGRLGWRSAFIEDSDPGYDKAQVIEVLSRDVDPRYLTYLESLGIPYFFAGEEDIDPQYALAYLCDHTDINCLLLEGGSIINGSFLRAGCVDELSLVVSPVIADKEAKPLFFDGELTAFELSGTDCTDGVAVMKYKIKENNDEQL
ncbi:MAG: dihydrofolate reductase family protein [Clostridia bacterium]|nr:dihydrofolate reductase family protein [Clostridia bacterium]